MAMQTIKLVIVGDGGVGKTCFLITYTSNTFPTEYVMTVFDEFTMNTMCEGRQVSVALWDTAGQDDYDRLRPLSYPDTDVFLIAYSIGDPNSFENVKTKWISELRHHWPQAPWVLVGTKADLRSDEKTISELAAQGKAPITTQQGQDLADSIGARSFFEVSSLRLEGLALVFDRAIRLGLGIVPEDEPKLPPKPDPPAIVHGPDLCDELKLLVNRKEFHDVVFSIGTEEIYAHKIVLCSAGETLKKLIEEQAPIQKLFTAENKGNCSVIAVNSSIKPVELVEFLTFIYNGKPMQSPTNQFLELAKACEIDATVDRRAELKNKIAVNLKQLWDVELVADDTKRLPSSKALLSCRCVHLRAKLSEKHREHVSVDISSPLLVSFLHYIHKDIVSAGDAEELLQLGEQWHMPGLVQTCEYVLVEEVITIKNVFRWTRRLREQGEGHRDTLHAYCLWLMQVNYNMIQNKKEFKELHALDQNEVRAKSWPGAGYEAKLQRWQQQHGKKKERCNVQ